jgi:hypothetical protein
VNWVAVGVLRANEIVVVRPEEAYAAEHQLT